MSFLNLKRAREDTILFPKCPSYTQPELKKRRYIAPQIPKRNFFCPKLDGEMLEVRTYNASEVENMLKHKEVELREEYEQILIQLLQEQHQSFTRYLEDCIFKQYENAELSYIN